MSYQQVILVGNVGSDPETRAVGPDRFVTNFSVAVNEKYGQNDTTTWFRVAAWGKLGEICATFVAKGMQVLVTGRIKANAYTDRQGQPAASLELTADTVKFLSRKETEPNMGKAEEVSF